MQVNPVSIKTPHLSLPERMALITSIWATLSESAEVHVALTYNKQTDTAPRIAGRDYIKLPGVDQHAQHGVLEVRRYTDNRQNRKLGRAGQIYLHVASPTRADGEKPYGHSNLRPEGITGFAVTGWSNNPNAGPSTPPVQGA